MIKSVAYVFVTGALLATAACTVQASAKSKTRFHQDGIAVTDTVVWAGQSIEIDNDGVNPAINGGVKVIADGATDTVTASATITAYADADDEASANLTLAIHAATPVRWALRSIL